MAQVVERRIGSAEVTGPTPVASLCKVGEIGHDLTGFLFDRKFLRNYLSNKNLSEGCTARGRGICLTAPLAREVCASTHFFINIGGQYGKGSISREF